MYLLQTSADLLNTVKAVFYLGVAIFFSLFLFYLAMMMRQMFLATKEMRERVHKIDEAITAFKQKIEHSASYLLLIGEGVKKLAELAMKYWGETKEKGKAKK